MSVHDENIQKKECYYFKDKPYCSYDKAIAARKRWRLGEIENELSKIFSQMLPSGRVSSPHGYRMGVDDCIRTTIRLLTDSPRPIINLLEEYLGYQERD